MDVFFILSKLFYQFLSPMYWILILIVWRYFAKKPKVKKRLSIAAIVLFILFSNEYLLSVVANSYQPAPAKLQDSVQYECGILLGGMTTFDKNNDGHFNENTDRFLQTVKLYHQKKIKKIVVTGGSGNLLKEVKSEALFLKPELIANGVNSEDIIIESNSRNTYENAVFTKKILDSLHIPPPYILITSATHMPRSVKVFHRAGMKEVIPYPCCYLIVREKIDLNFLLVPKAEVIYKWQGLLKEWVGIVAYKITGKA